MADPWLSPTSQVTQSASFGRDRGRGRRPTCSEKNPSMDTREVRKRPFSLTEVIRSWTIPSPTLLLSSHLRLFSPHSAYPVLPPRCCPVPIHLSPNVGYTAGPSDYTGSWGRGAWWGAAVEGRWMLSAGCAPTPRFLCWNVPSVRVFGGGAFGKWFGHEGRVLIGGISAVVQKAPERSLAPSAMWC